MSQIVDFSVIPRPLAPEMGANEAVRFLIYLINELPNHISGGGGGGGQQTNTANTPSILTTSGTALNGNLARIQWTIVNIGTTPLFVLLGSGASATVFHIPLKACSMSNDGTGGSVSDSTYTGLISVYGLNPSYVVTEL